MTWLMYEDWRKVSKIEETKRVEEIGYSLWLNFYNSRLNTPLSTLIDRFCGYCRTD